MTQYLDQSTINTQGSQPSITLPQTPMTTLEFTETIDMTDVQSYLGFLRTQIGRYMRVEQLMGSNVMENRYGFLVGVGISTMLALQTFLNVAVCTNLIPCTGISLPLFSYGGTALLIQLAEIGILLSVSREMPGNR